MRFPEFEGEWGEKELNKVCSFFSGGTPTSTNKNYYKGSIPFIGSGNIYDEAVEKYITREALDNSSAKIVSKGDILYALYGANSGDVSMSKISGAINQAILCIRTVENKTFLFQSLSFKKDKIVQKFIQGGQGNLSAQIIKRLKFAFPSLTEQQKIASFLTVIDSRIQTQNKIIHHLQSLIKGFSQKLFSQQLRFKDDNGNDFPEWDEKELDKIGKTINGLTGKTKEDFGKGKPYIQYKQIFDSSRINIKDCGLVDIKESENQVKVKYGDVFFTTSSETPNEIGTSSVLLNDVEEMYLNSFCFGFRVNPYLLNPLFSRFLFRSESFRKKIIPLAQGSTRYNISKSSFLKLKIIIPSLEEQTKIANFLSSLDSKLEKEKKLLEHYQQQKKYLLQNLFI